MKKLLFGLMLTLAVLAMAACSSDNGKAPDFWLTDAAGRQVALQDLLQENDAVVLVFYRGFF